MNKSRRFFIKRVSLLAFSCIILKANLHKNSLSNLDNHVVVNGWVIPKRDLG